jgi:hypothetical protein
MSFLTQHPTLKRYLIISLKNAVNAVLIDASLTSQWHFIFNFDNWAGVWALMRATAGVIIAREGLVWGAKLLKWTQTDVDPDAPEAALEQAAVKTREAAAASAQAGAAIEHAKDVMPPHEPPKE